MPLSPASTALLALGRLVVCPTSLVPHRGGRKDYPPRKAEYSHRPRSRVVLPLGACEYLGDIVITKASAKPERARFGSVPPGGRRLQHFVQANTQGGIDDVLEWFAKFGRAFLRFGRDIRIERQGSSHLVIMMF